MTETRTLTTRKGRTVETSFTDEQAIERLRELTFPHQPLEFSKFAVDLVNKHGRYGLSEEQFKWVHILVVEQNQPRVPEVAEDFDGTALIAMFDTAAEKLKRPKMKLGIEFGVVKLGRTTKRSKRGEGLLAVEHVSPRGFRTWVGWVNREGQLELGFKFRKSFEPGFRGQVLDLLRLLAEDPEKVAAERGRMAGHCCFCNLELTDERSKTVGYGPVCAKNYGLPWGNKAAKGAA
jgi:hypothetical protein